MRLVLMFVILLNLLYAGWHYVNPVNSSKELPPLADNLKSLELLREEPREVIENEAAENSLREPVKEQVVIEAEQAAIEPTGEQEVAAVTVPAREDQCFTLGPYKDDVLMQQIKDSLSQHVGRVKVRKRQEAEKYRYWVYIPSQGSRKRAKRMVQKLRDKKLKDFYIVLKGQQKNSISLGHFSDKGYANRRYKKVAALGFDAQIKAVYREYDVYWLDYTLKADRLEQAEKIEEYMTEGVSKLVRQCKA